MQEGQNHGSLCQLAPRCALLSVHLYGKFYTLLSFFKKMDPTMFTLVSLLNDQNHLFIDQHLYKIPHEMIIVSRIFQAQDMRLLLFASAVFYGNIHGKFVSYLEYRDNLSF